MHKKFFSNLILLLVLNLLVKPLAIFGIDASVQNSVGAYEYGIYFSLLNLSFLFNIIMDIGINNFTTTNISRHPHLASKYLGKLFNLRIILFALYAIITIFVGISIGYKGQGLYLLLILIFNQWIVTLIAYCRSHFGGLQLFKTDALISVLDKIILIIIAGYVLFLKTTEASFKIEWFIWMQTISYFLTFLTAAFLLIRNIGIPKIKFEWVFSWAILKKSFPYALLILLMMVYTRTDAVMLERIHQNGAYEAGVYALGFRLLDAFFMFGMIFANLLLPLFSKLVKENSSSVFELLKTSRNLLVGGAILATFVCLGNAQFILSLIYNENIAEAASCLEWLMAGFVGMCISLIYGTLLTAKGDLKFLNQISVVGIVLNIILNALLIPRYGATGSAFATFITQSFTALSQAIYCHALFKFKFKLSEFMRFCLLISLQLIILLAFKDNPFLLLIQLVFGGFCLVLLKFIDLKVIFLSMKSTAAT
jgi:O-antigen/teichoic acid export membrane protein